MLLNFMGSEILEIGSFSLPSVNGYQNVGRSIWALCDIY